MKRRSLKLAVDYRRALARDSREEAPDAPFPRRDVPRWFAARMDAPAPKFAGSVVGVDRSPSSGGGSG